MLTGATAFPPPAGEHMLVVVFRTVGRHAAPFMHAMMHFKSSGQKKPGGQVLVALALSL